MYIHMLIPLHIHTCTHIHDIYIYIYIKKELALCLSCRPPSGSQSQVPFAAQGPSSLIEGEALTPRLGSRNHTFKGN